MNKFGSATPYIASYVIIKKDGKIAMLSRENTGWMNGHYGLASGKVEKGESYTAAAIREAKEEIGITLESKHLEQIHTMHRKEEEGNEWVDVYFKATKWIGEPYNAEPDQHGDLAWFDIKELAKNTIPSLRYALEQIEQGKVYSEYGWTNE